MARFKPSGDPTACDQDEGSFRWIAAFLAAHAALAIAMYRVPALATAHAVLTVVIGLMVGLRARKMGEVLCACGYIVGSEVLWRMTRSAMFYEAGKYALAAVLLIWNLRFPTGRTNWLAVVFFLLLLPSVVLTITQVSDMTLLRMLISSNLSGPLALAVCALVLHKRPVGMVDIRRLILSLLGPMTGVAAICSFSTASLPDDYEFGSESNFDTSGGFGPNQVSSILGWGCLLAFLWIQTLPRARGLKVLAVMLICYFFAQSSLTFSRTGVWIAVATIIAASVPMMRNSKHLASLILGLVMIFGLGYFVVYPALDDFTGGKLSERFTEDGFSRREDIAAGDIEIALRYPVLGVGLGMGKQVRSAELGIGGPPHTEFTRLLAEHGSLGVIAVVLMLLMGSLPLIATRDPFRQGWVASHLLYACMFMSATGMRLVAPAFAIGIVALVPRILPQPSLAGRGGVPARGPQGGRTTPVRRGPGFRR